MSFGIGQAPQFVSPELELRNHAPAASTSRRRLADAVDEAFRIALSRGEIATAEELLNVLQGVYERARVKTVGDRRRSDALIERARQELEAKKAARYRRY